MVWWAHITCCKLAFPSTGTLESLAQQSPGTCHFVQLPSIGATRELRFIATVIIIALDFKILFRACDCVA